MAITVSLGIADEAVCSGAAVHALCQSVCPQVCSAHHAAARPHWSRTCSFPQPGTITHHQANPLVGITMGVIQKHVVGIIIYQHVHS